MSLVFLKNESNSVGNDNHQKPYDWTNHFASSMILPPNSQVAFVSATMQRKENVDISEPNNILYLQIGIPGLNKVMPIYLEDQVQPDWVNVLAELVFNLNNYGGQSDFMSDELISPYDRGWSGAYSVATDKITLKCKQRLQPADYGTQFNPMRNIATGYSWGGIDELGAIFRQSPNLVVNYNAGIPSEVPVNPGIATSIGRANLDLQNGQATGTPSFYNDGSWGMVYSNTGIKRSVGNVIGGGWNATGSQVGGGAVYLVDCSPGADSATPRAEVPNVVVGVQSIQFIEGQEPAGLGSMGFVNNLDLNNSVGGSGGSQSNSRYTLGVRIDRQQLFVEIQNADAGTPDNGGLPALGSCGNSRHSIVFQADLNDWAALATQPDPNTSSPSRKFQLRFRWTSPYCMAVDGSTNYNQDTNIGDWFELYDMATGDTPAGVGAATKMFIPSWYGDMGLVMYNRNRCRQEAYGNFDVRRGYSAGLGLFPDYELMMSKVGSYSGDPIVGSATRWLKTIKEADLPAAGVPETFDANGYAQKEIFLVGNPLIDAPVSIDKFKKWKPAYLVEPRFTLGQPNTTLGVMMGFLDPGEDGVIEIPPDVAGVFDEYGKIGKNGVSEEDIKQSIHIQLTDLPIQSKNGVSSQQVADIAVVHNYGDGGTSVGAKLVYQHYTNEKNWIDLNNIGEMTLNRLRVYCSYDNNEPAVGLVDKTDVLVMFRQKPMTDTSVPNQVISNTGVDFYSRDTTTRVA